MTPQERPRKAVVSSLNGGMVVPIKSTAR
jgi:hypothetical protein